MRTDEPAAPAAAVDISRDLLAAAVIEADLCVAILSGSDLRFSFVNPAYAAIAPGTPMLGRTFREVFPAAAEGGSEARLRRVLETGEPWHIERYPASRAAARGTTWEGRAARLPPIPGEPPSVVVLVRDVTERRRAEDALRERTALIQAISDTSGDVIYAKDRAGRLLFANPATLALVGKPLDQVLGRTDAEILDDAATAREVMENDRRIMERGAPEELEERVPMPDGRERVWLSRKVPARDEAGAVVGLLGISRDITERKRGDAALRDSEQRFRSVVENMSEGLMLFDASGNLTYQNPASLRIHGFAPESDGRIAHDALPVTWKAWDDHGRPVPFDGWPVSRVFRHERFQDQVLHVVRVETGQEFYASYNGCPIEDAEGNIVLGFITIREITAQVRAQLALAARERRLRLLIEANPMGVAVGDLVTGRMAEANDAFLRILGRSRAELSAGGINWRDVTPREWLTGDERAIAQARARGASDPYEKEYLRPDGSRVPILVACAIPDPSTDEAVAFAADLSERKRVEAALREANEKLHEADRRKDEFLGMLSHELRNPLAPIRNSSYLLRQAAPGSDQARRAQAVIERQTEHLTRLVDDLLDVTRIARGKIELRRTRVDLREVVVRAAEDFRLTMDDRGVAFRVVLPEAKVWADVDATRVTQVVGNLLHNAAKFTRRGDEVTLALSVDAGEARISVRDTGAGIEPALLGSMFDPFVQGERTLARTEGGLGLGLALVKGITELHGGSVHAESAGKGKGSEFVVRLPVAGTTARLEPARAGAGAAGGGRRVLVVDDNADAADTLADLLRMLGHDVEVAYDGAAALDAALARPPDVVLCDLGLPDLDGYEVARRLRAGAPNGLRIIAVSGYAQPEDVARATEAGFDGHVAKPPDPDQLAALIG